MIAPEDYCREIESYLCRKNDGHLIRIVGPAFEQVSGWAREGIPLKIALAGVDRCFERYYRKGPRRRPVRIEFCEPDVRDAFDDWRRAVGVARVPLEREGDEDVVGGGRRTALGTHVMRALARLTSARASTHAASALDDAIDPVVRRLDAMQAPARGARGDARAAIVLELDSLDRELLEAAVAALSEADRATLNAEADRELTPFRSRMLPETYARARQAAFDRLVRDRFGLPTIRHE